MLLSLQIFILKENSSKCAYVSRVTVKNKIRNGKRAAGLTRLQHRFATQLL